MKSKALIVGGLASFKGPWVNLEKGEWEVDVPQGAVVKREFPTELEILTAGERVIVGPARVMGEVLEKYDGEEVFMHVRQIK